MWLLLLLASCAVTAPDWTESCSCAQGEVCVSDGGYTCATPDEACGTAFDSCDLSQVDEACAAAMCDYLIGDTGGIAGSFAYSAECFETEEQPLQTFLECNESLTF